MTSREASEPRTFAVDLPTSALSPAARAVGEALGRWRSRIAEAQTLSRLVVSLLQGFDRMDVERRSHLGRLLHIEARSLSKLPRLDLPSLRTTTHARHSGVDLRSADAVTAEHYLQTLRGDVMGSLTLAIDAVMANRPHDVRAYIEGGQRLLDELARLTEMLETMMYPRVTSPPIEIGVAFERAGASRSHAITLDGESNAELAQVRGLLRLLAELLQTVGGQAYVHVSRAGGWIEVAVSPSATAASDEVVLPASLVELLRFAAYLLRAQARFDGGAWQVAFVAVDR